MGKLELSGIFKAGQSYDVITKYKEIPVKAHLKLNWVDDEGRLLGFDWGRTHMKAAFSTLDPVYVKLSSKEYAQTQVFSNLGKELVLTVENFVEPPEFIHRRSVRVEPDENKPVIVELSFDGVKFNIPAKDVSETGIGLSLSRDENRDFIEFIQEKVEALKEDEYIEFPLRIHLPDNGTATGRGRLKNVVGLGKDVYVRLGFEVDFPREEITKIRKYVIGRQKEIIQSLRFVK
ncbi:hypothetical protein [Hydrogenivirga sp. 128-5-R1-1]|uniref:hypothetical protein n=1 Tax=Hydrogenivirga sp. 128-5-R1-1 TaxID=392423 RepID=UPI00015F1900|nr:hypothetical protein [Hydrogenivirga sp. 128-5-R1-1]EDP75532.1 riboflavin synthase subunit alpha [Hydrogenivirga sp. 128-5-R1-1]